MRSEMPAETDWAAWSREAARLMQRRNDTLIERYQLTDRHYRWNLDRGRIGFLRESDAVVADLCVIGSVADNAGTFLWAWENDAVPAIAKQRLAAVRDFGERHDLGRLKTPEWVATHQDGLEMLAVAGRILDADAVWIEREGDRTFYFTLHEVHVEALAEIPWITA